MAISAELFATAVRLGLVDELDRYRMVPTMRPDPFDRLTPARRAEAIIRSCASGVSAYDLPLQTTFVEHVPTKRRNIPPPPRRGRS